MKDNQTKKFEKKLVSMIEDETTKKAFEEDSHLYLMHPKMYVVPDYTRREQEKDAQQKTAVELTTQIT